jgi:hypothetical protein
MPRRRNDADPKLKLSSGRLGNFPRAAIVKFQFDRPWLDRLEVELSGARLAGGGAGSFGRLSAFVEDPVEFAY